MRSIALIMPLLMLAAGSSHAQDAEAGKKVFARCMACHNADAPGNKVGPSLMGVMGRTAGVYEGYNFSKAMVEAGENGLVWDDETIREFVKDPREMVEGTKMVFPGLKDDEEISDLIAYLDQFSE